MTCSPLRPAIAAFLALVVTGHAWAVPSYSDIRGVDHEGREVRLIGRDAHALCVRPGQKLRLRACRGWKETFQCCKPSAGGCYREWTYSDLKYLDKWDSESKLPSPVFRAVDGYVELTIPKDLKGTAQIKVGYWSTYRHQTPYLMTTHQRGDLTCAPSDAITAP